MFRKVMDTESTDEAFRIAREVGCIHSIQGYDLSYAYVIIGENIRLDPGTGRLVADRAGYFGRNGKATATDEELTEYLKNIYYVLLTRASTVRTCTRWTRTSGRGCEGTSRRRHRALPFPPLQRRRDGGGNIGHADFGAELFRRASRPSYSR